MWASGIYFSDENFLNQHLLYDMDMQLRPHKSREYNYPPMPHFNDSLVAVGWIITPQTTLHVNIYSFFEFMVNFNMKG